ncbi:hypothetical protein ZYGR_0I00730 [Zygosaccharomyces rouxii]|uniref:ZYRO0C01804p n=2 Tax=Zygosaccharomyces rouxii TaxID=4956 RepID=C5DSP0_ZYGRC|nr:uncharacterized protein ZYRO0C01804g [Zygosaccharomyces rouxii]KAH9202009.1 cortical protein marker for cell polarity-domain-containing protein [Zygosaccharomyces rouxii]GAV47777.1 hypothetical protein ZYGR_0I00730 [Zygosaccharomyces rouxii]CAR26801.1 ZYRO0C01804p [Zygosaccharomyces rouxii]
MLFFALLSFYFLLAITNGSQLSHLQQLLNASNIQVPKLDLTSSRNQALELLGDFQDLTFYKYTGQENFTSPLNSSTDSHGLIYYSNDTFLQLANGSNDTDIKQIVPLGEDSFILSGSGHIDGYNLQRQLHYNLTDLSFKPIFQEGLTEVNSILVDQPLVYFGGNFTFSNGSQTGHSVVLWNSEKNSTSLLPFIGFGQNSTVNSIIRLDRDNILFAGNFYELDDVKLLENHILGSNNSSSKSNWTDVELGLAIPLQNANWTSSSSQFDADDFICPDPERESWLQSGTSGSLACSLPQETTPYKIRIYNSPVEDNEVSLFRILAEPTKGILNLSYVDPEEGELRYCDAFCPLYNRQRLEEASSNSSSVENMTTFSDNNTTDIKWGRDFQEFAFVNNVPISSVEFVALSSYGSNVGLSSWQFFQSRASIYANNSLNQPACGKMQSYSNATISNNDWRQGLNGQTYLSTSYVEDQGNIPRVTFHPQIQYPGNYSIKLYTPGCLGDGTCNQRAIVNVTLWDGDSNEPLSSEVIYENNNELKYDELWDGHLKSSPKVTLEYHSPIYPNNPTSVVVADYISLEAKSFDHFEKHKKDITLNGIFQYQISNFTKNITKESIGNTSLDVFPLSYFSNNSSLFASLYENDTLLLADSKSKAAEIKLDKNWSVDSSKSFNLASQVRGIGSYSDGLILFGDYNSSQRQPLALSFNGSFNSYDKINRSVERFTNIDLKGTELLVFDNEFFYNVSSQSYVSNTTRFSLSVWSAGQNTNGDLIFSGAVSDNDYENLQGPVSLFQNGSAVSSNIKDNINPYMGAYLNDTLTAYAYKDGSDSRIVFSNGDEGPWRWTNSIETMIYRNRDALLALGTSSSPSLPQLSVLNLTTSEVLANETLDKGAEVNSMILFGKNSTLLIGGNFSFSDAHCNGLCLYNYKNKRWSTFANDSITGQVTQVQLRNSSELLIAGSLRVNGTSDVNLVSVNITGQGMKTLLRGWEGPLRSFVVSEDRLVVWNDTSLMAYDNTSWRHISTSNSTSFTKLQDIHQVSLEHSLEKRANSSSNSNLDGLLVYGNDKTQGDSYQASIYDYYSWTPLFIANSKSENSNSGPNIFMNQDVSDFFISEQMLPNPTNHTSSRSSSSSSSAVTSNSGDKKHRASHKVDRGYVVLIGLALAIGTVVVIGVFGILIAYMFGEDIGGYEFLSPPAEGTKAAETAPPAKSSKFL